MTEQELTDSLRPGEWAVDTSAHHYKTRNSKRLVRYRWEAVNQNGLYKRGLAVTQQDAEKKAQGWADGPKIKNGGSYIGDCQPS